MSWTVDTRSYDERMMSALLYHEAGKVTKCVGMIYEAHLPGAAVGSLCRIYPSGSAGEEGIDAEGIGFRDKRVILMPFDDAPGINNDSRVVLRKKASSVKAGDSLLGRVLDGKGDPIDGKGPLGSKNDLMIERGLYQLPTHPLERAVISEPLDLGV